jgi:hypothetical protein
MTEGWANFDAVGSGDVFHALHAGLTVKLISTKRPQLMTCSPHENLPVVMARNTEAYDFLPVLFPGDAQQGQIVGLFHAAKFFDDIPIDGRVEQHYMPLSEEHLIGADASILKFVIDADKRPCRLVVSGANIVGLVSLSDLQKLPVRAALFALITGFEISMFEAIKREYLSNDDWKRFLSDGRRAKINEEIEQSHRGNGFVEELLFTQFCDKSEILLKGFQLPQSKTIIRRQLEWIQELRDKLAHANEYASSPEQARNVCAVVRSLLELREQIAVIEGLESAMNDASVARMRAK